VLRVLGTSRVCLHGNSAPASIEVDADIIMRNLVLKNQLVVGTVNADKAAFQNAIHDLGVFIKRWPAELRSLITGRYTMENYRELLTGERGGIKNVIALA
jgi:hypothetical protein